MAQSIQNLVFFKSFWSLIPFSFFSYVFSKALSIINLIKVELRVTFTLNKPLKQIRKQQGQNTTLPILKSGLCNTPKTIFIEKYTCATNGCVDRAQTDPQTVLQNRRWEQKLPKISAQENQLSVGRQTDLCYIGQTTVHSP